MQLDHHRHPVVGELPFDDQHMHATVSTLLSQNRNLRHLDVCDHAPTACAASLSSLPLLTKLVWVAHKYSWDVTDEDAKEAAARRKQQVILPQYAALHEMMYR